MEKAEGASGGRCLNCVFVSVDVSWYSFLCLCVSLTFPYLFLCKSIGTFIICFYVCASNVFVFETVYFNLKCLYLFNDLLTETLYFDVFLSQLIICKKFRLFKVFLFETVHSYLKRS